MMFRVFSIAIRKKINEKLSATLHIKYKHKTFYDFSTTKFRDFDIFPRPINHYYT